jgi:hypothetical protein
VEEALQELARLGRMRMAETVQDAKQDGVGRGGSRRELAAPLLLVAASVAGLAAAYAVKAQCLNREWNGVQFRRLCYRTCSRSTTPGA